MNSEVNPGEKQEAGVKKKHRTCTCRGLLRSLCAVLEELPLMLLVFAISFCSPFIICIMALPLLVVSFLVARLLQLLTNGDAYYKVIHVKAILRFLMLECLLILLIFLGIFYLLASTVSKIKHITIYDLSIRNWINVSCTIIGLYAFNFFLSIRVERISRKMLWQCDRRVYATQAAAEIVNCLILWWAKTLVLKRVPPFKKHQLLGLPTHKWIQVVIFVIIGIDTISCGCHLITILLHKAYRSLRPTPNVKSKCPHWVKGILGIKYAVYWADGLVKNIIFIFGSMVLFLTWNSYFRSHLNATPEDKEVVRFGTISLASLLVLAVLWLIKSYILLSWKAKHVYAQLSPRLVENLEELYFLGILGRAKFDILRIGSKTKTGDSIQPHNSRKDQDEEPSDEEKGSIVKQHKRELSDISVPSNEKDEHNLYMILTLVRLFRFDLHLLLINEVRDDLYISAGQLGHRDILPTLHDLHKMAQYFLRAQPTLSEDKYVPEVLQHLTTSANKCTRSTSLEEYLKQLIKGNNIHHGEGDLKNTSDSQLESEWEWFKNLVAKQSHRLSSKGINATSFKSVSMEVGESSTLSSNDINESRNFVSNETNESQIIEKEALKAWLENARGTCMELGNTLCSAEEVVNCLNNIISGLLIGATFIMWLLLTGLATTNILVLIASPLLAATFIFGDTCKSLFQGIIFAYVCHPYNVGDVVIVDDKMMEVKILGVRRTIFAEIGNNDEVTYPNSELANKKIINYKSDFNWNDSLEFTLKSFQREKIETLRNAIKEELSKDEKCSPNHLTTEALATADGDNMKVVVHLKYKTDNQYGMTLYERLQEKHNLRSTISIKIWDFINKQKMD